MYVNHNSPHKQYCRNLIGNIVKEYPRDSMRSVVVFTLPSTNFSLEKELSVLPKTKLICAENDIEVYSKQLKSPEYKEIRRNKIHDQFILYFQNAFEVLRAYKYNVIWLDLCGGLNIVNLNNILSLVQSDNISNNCYIAITILRGREHNLDKIVNFYGFKSIGEFRNKGLQELITQFAKEKQRKCTLITKYDYRDKSPMSMYIFKIN